MAYVNKRKSDLARGKAGKWTMYWVGADGKKKSRAGSTDKAESLRVAQRLEDRARKVATGEVDLAEEGRREQARRPVADHCEDYRKQLLAKGDTLHHCRHVAGAVRKLLESAGVASIADLAPDRIRSALGRMKVDRSARTCNHALGAVKSFATWLHHANRIEEVPRGLAAIKPFSERDDRRRVRRALTMAEVGRLLEFAAAGQPIKLSRRGCQYAERWITGPERAALYRLAMGTGFRANELRSLTPESFRLDGPEPEIALAARDEKNRKGTVQPITRELADQFRPFLEGKPPGRPVLDVPEKTAKLLRADLEAAGISYKTSSGVADFHALRATYITHLVNSGVNVKIVQTLARHSTITLTLDRYTSVEGSDLRKALEGGD